LFNLICIIRNIVFIDGILIIFSNFFWKF